jgi:hypothetical protein
VIAARLRVTAVAVVAGAGGALLAGGDMVASAQRAGAHPSARRVGPACRAAHRGRRACARRPSARPPAAAPAPSSAGSVPATGAAVGVHEHEFRITLTRTDVRGGRVVVELANEGEDPHNLLIAPVGTGATPVDPAATAADALLAPQVSFPTLSAGQRQTRTVTLGPGVWRLWCSLPGHDAAGMHAVLRVLG